MYQYKINSPFPETLRGVETRVTQILDIGTLEKSELTRVLNAVKRGRVAASGYVADLARLCAAEIGVASPLSIYKQNWSHSIVATGLPASLKEQHFEQLFKVSQVRHELFLSNNPDVKARYIRWGRGQAPKCELWSNYHGHSTRVQLVGWDGDLAGCTKAVLDTVNKHCPAFAKDMQTLHDYIASKPRIVRGDGA